ncbi:hypothetical protein GS490_06590 [Rhodococcus hoagii]|nr:hypothetical protein [Prescottella equi]NKS15987.1 hypothetical protein [Prescottella equi]NKS79401.1 hypothetical protein [Prescottella equi]
MAEHDAHEAADHADSFVDRDEVLPHIVGHLPGRRATVIPDQPGDDREAVAEALCERGDHPWALLAPDEADHYFGQADCALALLRERGYAKAGSSHVAPAEPPAHEARARQFLEAIVAMPPRIRSIDEAAPVAVDRILHLETFDALATMLGYLKSHSEGEEFRLRVAGTERIYGEAWWTLDHALESAEMLSEVGSQREVVRRRVVYGPWETL